jgi:ADP-ribose pyrophosphatase YjhB (NUDIX family)
LYRKNLIGKGVHMLERSKHVWLGVAGLVITKDGRWLVVKKSYGGLKGKWSLPAGFVQPGETADEAVVREIKEETGIETKVIGLFGLRTGVIRNEISDNMLLFLLEPNSEKIFIQEKELLDVAFMDEQTIKKDPDSSLLLKELNEKHASLHKKPLEGINPGEVFQYTAYKLFI